MSIRLAMKSTERLATAVTMMVVPDVTINVWKSGPHSAEITMMPLKRIMEKVGTFSRNGICGENRGPYTVTKMQHECGEILVEFEWISLHEKWPAQTP